MTFPGMTPDFILKPHQENAVARALFGGNTLFAHTVGAGKTAEMITTAMEGKRLGLHHKSMIILPKHTIEQMATEFLRLYPAANLLVAGEKDFTSVCLSLMRGQVPSDRRKHRWSWHRRALATAQRPDSAAFSMCRS